MALKMHPKEVLCVQPVYRLKRQNIKVVIPSLESQNIFKLYSLLSPTFSQYHICDQTITSSCFFRNFFKLPTNWINKYLKIYWKENTQKMFTAEYGQEIVTQIIIMCFNNLDPKSLEIKYGHRGTCTFDLYEYQCVFLYCLKYETGDIILVIKTFVLKCF